MKRLVIIAILIVGGVLIFNNEEAQKVEKLNEKVSEETNIPEEKEEAIQEIEKIETEEVEKEDGEINEEAQEKQEEEIVQEEVKVIVPVQEIVKKLVPAEPVIPKVIMPIVVSDMKVFLYDFDIDVSQKEISAGKINFEVLNNGRFAHDFAISGLRNFGKVRPGEIKTFSAFLNAGKIEIYSARNQDAEYGMVENIIVR
jgi:hypothetical protein